MTILVHFRSCCFVNFCKWGYKLYRQDNQQVNPLSFEGPLYGQVNQSHSWKWVVLEISIQPSVGSSSADKGCFDRSFKNQWIWVQIYREW